MFFRWTLLQRAQQISGPTGGERRIFDHLESMGRPFRLLALDQDPVKHLRPGQLRWDVPFNQNWTLEPGDNFESYLGKFSVGSQKTMQYLLRRFIDPGAITVVADAAESWEEISKHMDHTALAFDERGRTSVYNNAGFRKAAKATVSPGGQPLGLAATGNRSRPQFPDSEPVGLGVIVTPPKHR